jgi:hypothetical protein
MSSAKTIADILAFAELIDVKSFIGNPFTSQPMYIAACAFLAEAAAHASQPSSRERTPSDQTPTESIKPEKQAGAKGIPRPPQHLTAKHTLLATAANQNYQRCYKALRALETYWAGTRYILTALDQKSKGITDPLLFTSEDIDSEMPSTELNFTTPGWRRSTSNSASMEGRTTPGPLSGLRGIGDTSKESVWPSQIDPIQAIGWSLTGTTNSPAPNLSLLYQTSTGEIGSPSSPALPESHSQYVHNGSSVPSEKANIRRVANYSRRSQNPIMRYTSIDQSLLPNPPSHVASMPPPPVKYPSLASDPASTAEADLLLSLHSPYSNIASASQPVPRPHQLHEDSIPPSQHIAPIPSYDFNQETPKVAQYYPNASMVASTPTPYSDMMIESQDIDMSGGSQGGFTFPSGEMIPWLEYLPQDVLNYFGELPDYGSGGLINPAGPGPPADNGRGGPQ